MTTALNEALLQSLPDLVLLVRRDGVIVAKCGGGDIEATRGRGDLQGSSLQDTWPGDIADHLLNLVRKALKTRACVVGRYRHNGRVYELRTQPVGVDRAMLMVRAPWSATPEAAEKQSMKSRESFAQELTEAVESSRFKERPFALMALHIGGLAEIEKTLGAASAEEALAVAVQRLGAARKILGAAPAAIPPLARLDSDLFAVVLKDVAHRSTQSGGKHLSAGSGGVAEPDRSGSFFSRRWQQCAGIVEHGQRDHRERPWAWATQFGGVRIRRAAVRCALRGRSGA